MIPKINSAHGSDTRNIINRAIEVLNRLGIDVQTLVAEGQLTPAQYAQLIYTVEGLVKSGEIDKNDLSPELKTELEKVNEKISEGALTRNDLDTTSNSNLWDINDFNEQSRAILQGLEPGSVNAVLGNGNVKTDNIENGAVTNWKRTARGHIGGLFINQHENLPDLDLNAGQLIIYPEVYVTYDANRSVITNETVVPLYRWNNSIMSSQILVFNVSTKEFRFTTSSVQDRNQNEVELMTLSLDRSASKILSKFTTFDFTVNGEPIAGEGQQSNESIYHIIDIDAPGLYTHEPTPEDYSNFDDATASEIHQMFDDLQSNHSDFMSVEFVGEEQTGLPIYAYKFQNDLPNYTHYYQKKPKVLYLGGIHGFEKMGVLALYFMAKEMCEKWKDSLHIEQLRHNSEIIIIPVANPYGFNNFIRGNSNGVDINSNFPPNWEEGDSSSNMWGGSSPASELETQHLMAFMDANDDIDMMFDVHNFRHLEADWRLLWIPTSRSKEQILSVPFISAMSRKWVKDLGYVDGFYGNTNIGRTNGQSVLYAMEKGAKYATTFEVRDRIPLESNSQYTPNAIKVAVESLVNWATFTLKELTR